MDNGVHNTTAPPSATTQATTPSETPATLSLFTTVRTANTSDRNNDDPQVAQLDLHDEGEVQELAIEMATGQPLVIKLLGLTSGRSDHKERR